jgi:hypothetical protein
MCNCVHGWYGRDCSLNSPDDAAQAINKIGQAKTQVRQKSHVPEAVKDVMQLVMGCEQIRKEGLLMTHPKCKQVLAKKTAVAATKNYVDSDAHLFKIFTNSSLPLVEKQHIAALLRLDVAIVTFLSTQTQHVHQDSLSWLSDHSQTLLAGTKTNKIVQKIGNSTRR